jgi:hypothetical protein
MLYIPCSSGNSKKRVKLLNEGLIIVGLCGRMGGKEKNG